jgi:hypothetical protein
MDANEVEQAKADRQARIAERQKDRDHRKEENEKQLKHRKDQNRKDRWLRAATSFLSAIVAIVVAFIAFREAIEKVNAPSQHFEVIGAEARNYHEIVKIDTLSGEAWALKDEKNTDRYDWITIRLSDDKPKATTLPSH